MKLMPSRNYEVTERSFENTRTKRLGISDEMIGMVTSMLTHFYANPEYATARETLANCYDACIEANVLPRIEVTTSGSLSSTAEVVFKDEGIGMTPDIFENVFAAYGESTKRDTNDQTGGFGLGCKTPYTMSDTFTVITARDGIKTLGIFTRDEEDFGNADFMDLGETEEHGTTVTIPLSRNNIRSMEQAVRRAAFAMPPETVYLNGQVCPSIHDDSLLIGNALVLNNRVEGLSEWNVLMGGILYPLDNINFRQDDTRSRWGRPKASVVFLAEIGDFKPTPQRDQLQDIRFNRERLAERYQSFREAIPTLMTQYLSDNFDHFSAIAECSKHGNWFSLVTEGQIMVECNWNGKTLSPVIDIPDKVIYTKKYRRDLTRADNISLSTIRADAVVAYVGMDADSLRDRKMIMNYNARAKASNQDSTVWFIFLNEGEVIEHEWLRIGGDNSQVTLVTRDEVYAVRPRSTRSQRASAYTTTYTVRVYDSEGNFTSSDLIVEDVPETALFIDGNNWGGFPRMFPAFFAGKSIIVLRPGQSREVMQRRLPSARNISDEVDAAFTAYVDSVFTDEMIEMVARRYMGGMWGHTLAVFTKIAEALPESKFASILNKYYLPDDPQYPDKVILLYDRYSDYPAVRAKLKRADEIRKANTISNIYPLIDSPRDNENYLKHAKMYVMAVENEEN